MAPYTVVVVAHDQPRQLIATLFALRQHARPDEVLIVDNRSSTSLDGVVRLSQLPAHIMRFDEHQSLGAAFNAGIDAAANDMILLLHSDVLLERDPSVAVAFLAQSTDTGIAGGKLFQPGREPRRIAHAGYRVGRGRANPQSIGNSQWDTFHERRHVACVSTACMLIQRNRVRFDERFWFRLEDADFCHQYGQLGLRTTFLPDLQATHLESGGIREHAKDPFWSERQIASQILYHDRWCTDRDLHVHAVQRPVRGQMASSFLLEVDSALRRQYPTLAMVESVRPV